MLGAKISAITASERCFETTHYNRSHMDELLKPSHQGTKIIPAL